MSGTFTSKKSYTSNLPFSKLKSTPTSSRDLTIKETGMRQLSAAEERKIDEAIELANSFARLNTSEHVVQSPLSLCNSSSESVESPTHNNAGSFRFGTFKRRATANSDDKRTFAEGLPDNTAIITADAQAAYNELVSKNFPSTTNEAYTTKLTTKLPSGLHHRNNRLLRDSRAFSRRFQRSSLSESDQELVLVSALTDRLTRRSTHPDSFKRSMSLTENTEGPHFCISVEPLRSSIETDTQSDEHILVSSVSESAESHPPPLPPRFPLRPSTVNTRPRQRNFPLTRHPARQRSYSEVEPFVTSQKNQDLVLPRRRIKSIDDNGCREVLPVLPISLLDSTRNPSDDDVFSIDEQHKSCNAYRQSRESPLDDEKFIFSDTKTPKQNGSLSLTSYEDLMEFALDGFQS